jgi:hypothetical protein
MEQVRQYNKNNEISWDTFLFGGEFDRNGSQYNRQLCEGFHCITKEFEFKKTDENFWLFKIDVEYLLTEYFWDTHDLVTVDTESSTTQSFSVPSEKEIKDSYNELSKFYC